ncbi:MAG: MGMT family protein [Hyphomicrobium sp.]
MTSNMRSKQFGGGGQRGALGGRLLALLRALPAGRVTTPEVIAATLDTAPALVVGAIARLSEDERDMAPWHRVVASGGAIGRGPWREAQFARLVREGICISPAGIVQDMGRVLLADLSDLPAKTGKSGHHFAVQSEPEQPRPAAPVHRSRGMKDRPGG